MWASRLSHMRSLQNQIRILSKTLGRKTVSHGLNEVDLFYRIMTILVICYGLKL